MRLNREGKKESGKAGKPHLGLQRGPCREGEGEVGKVEAMVESRRGRPGMAQKQWAALRNAWELASTRPSKGQSVGPSGGGDRGPHMSFVPRISRGGGRDLSHIGWKTGRGLGSERSTAPNSSQEPRAEFVGASPILRPASPICSSPRLFSAQETQ